jgi:hypothetical protein
VTGVEPDAHLVSLLYWFAPLGVNDWIYFPTLRFEACGPKSFQAHFENAKRFLATWSGTGRWPPDCEIVREGNGLVPFAQTSDNVSMYLRFDAGSFREVLVLDWETSQAQRFQLRPLVFLAALAYGELRCDFTTEDFLDTPGRVDFLGC